MLSSKVRVLIHISMSTFPWKSYRIFKEAKELENKGVKSAGFLWITKCEEILKLLEIMGLETEDEKSIHKQDPTLREIARGKCKETENLVSNLAQHLSLS